MNIAIIGYGKMGHAVERAALKRGHDISFRIDQQNADEIESVNRDNSDAVIEFTHPVSALAHIRRLVPTGVPFVTGTTGWYDQMAEAEAAVQEHDGALLYGANFSIGVNLLFRLNDWLAEHMNKFDAYDCFLEERHHRHKADAPSGTASRLLADLLRRLDRKNKSVMGDALRQRPVEPDELNVSVVRAGEIKGEHRVTYASETDALEIRHTAYARDGFAEGAVMAAEWLQDRKGFYEFSETLDLW